MVNNRHRLSSWRFSFQVGFFIVISLTQHYFISSRLQKGRGPILDPFDLPTCYPKTNNSFRDEGLRKQCTVRATVGLQIFPGVESYMTGTTKLLNWKCWEVKSMSYQEQTFHVVEKLVPLLWSGEKQVYIVLQILSKRIHSVVSIK